jgi:hypothetical protein
MYKVQFYWIMNKIVHFISFDDFPTFNS